MEIRLLLLKAISVMYYASYVSGPTNTVATDSVNLVDRLMDRLVLPEDSHDSTKERSALLKLRSQVIWMKNKGANEPYDLNDLMTRIRVSVADNDRLYDLFTNNLLVIDDADAAKDKYDSVRGELYEYIAAEDFLTILRKATRTLGFEKDGIENLSLYRDELMVKLQNLSLEGKRRASSTIRTIDLCDITDASKVYEMGLTAIDPRAILKLPFKAANRMTGDQGGARRGEWACTPALSGNNKSGDLLDTFISMCIFNHPVLFDDTKKPLHVYTTIEDKLELVMQKLFVILMQHEHALPIKVTDFTPDEMSTYVQKRLTANGWHVKFLELPGGTNWQEYVEELRTFQEDGYEIVSAGCDYVNLLGKQGIPIQVAGDDVQLVHRYVRFFTSPNNIYHYTAHQLSTQAKELARQRTDYITQLPGKGYYEGCKKLDTELDYEKYLAKTLHAGVWWQEVMWGKHRKMGATPENDKYYALKFYELPGMIGFRYDYDLDEDLSYKKIGGRAASDGEGYDYRDFD